MISHDLVTWTSPGGGDVRIALPLTARDIDAPCQGVYKALRDNPYSNDMPVVIAPGAADDARAYERALVRQQIHGELAYWLPLETGEAHVHDVTIFPYEGVYIGFPCKLDNQVLTNPYWDDGKMYAELGFSRDLKKWTRYRDMVLAPGPPGVYDGAP